MSTPQPTPQLLRSFLRPLAAVALPALLLACQSGPKTTVNLESQLDIHRAMALGHYELGNLNQAERQALKGLEIDDDDRSLRLILGWILVRRGDVGSLERAAWVFEEFIDDHGGESRAWLGLAAARERLGVAYQAVAREISSGDRLPDKGSPSQRAAELEELATEAWEDARKLYSRTLSEQSGSLRALDGEQRVAARLGEYDHALEWSARLIETASAEQQWYQSALREQELDVRDEALMRDSEREIRRLLTDTHLVASSIHVAQDRPAQALEHLDRALELNPEYIEGYSRRAQLRYQIGEFDGAYEDISKFIGKSKQPIDAPEMKLAFEIMRHAERQDPSLDFDSVLDVGFSRDGDEPVLE